MSARRLALLLATVAAGGLGGAAMADQPQVIGIAAAVLNNVRIRGAGAAHGHAALVKQRVALADEVETGGHSQLQVLLLDRSSFTVGANARLTIDRYVYDPARGARSVAASVTKGAFRFISGRPDSAGNAAINTPVAAIGVRGTIIEGVVGADAAAIVAGEPGLGRRVRSNPETATLIVLRGPGLRTRGHVLPGAIDVTAGGRTVSADRPMLAIYVPGPGMAPIGPFTLSDAGLREIQALLFPALAETLGLPLPGGGSATRSNGTGFERPDRAPLLPYPGYPRPGYPRPGDPPPDAPRGQGGFFPQFPGGQTGAGTPARAGQQDTPAPAATPTPGTPNRKP